MNDRTFFDGTFHKGQPAPVEVVDRDFASEYSLAGYLGQVTLGQEVAVLFATLSFGLEPADCEPLGIEWKPEYQNPNLIWSYETTLAILPNIGIWVCEPAFDSVKTAFELARQKEYVINSFLQTNDTPVHIALFAMNDQPPNLAGVDPKYYYGPEAYGALADSLSRRARPFEPARVDDAIRRLMELISASDVKEPDSHWLNPLPRWLARHVDVALAA